MKSNCSSLAVTVLAACAALVFALPAINAQTLEKAPDNPAFLQYQLECAQKASASKTFSGYSHGYIPSPVDLSYLRGRASARISALQALPLSYDLRTQGKLTPIKSQSPWGTCWAFATYGSLESTLMPAEENYFSVNNLVNNHGFDYGYNDGGNAFMSTAYLSRWLGPINNAVDPYPNPGHSPFGLTVQKHTQEVVMLPQKANALDNATIKQAVMNYGAMYVTMYVDDDHYNSAHASFYYNGVTNANHAVAIVGWNDDYPKSRFEYTPPGDGAFIVRNSWGTNWGEQGYFYCSYYDTVMGHDENVAFNNAEAVTNYGSVYQYDPLGWVNSCGYPGSPNAWGANMFTATNNELLRAVGFYATDVDVNYTIYIYANVTAGSPTNGTLKLTQTGAFAYPGYHTVALNTPVELQSGRLFSVVIKFINSSPTHPLAFEYAQPNYSSLATSSPGQSYVSLQGTSWIDLTKQYATANVCIKAFCGGGDVPDASTTGDFDGDGLSDLISVVGSNWYAWFSKSHYLAPCGPCDMGIAGTPVTGDIDGDGLADLISVVGSNWYVRFSGLQYQGLYGPYDLGFFGTPVTGDVDGDGRADLISVVGSYWYALFSTSQYLVPCGLPFDMGISGTPATGDIDGDGLADLISVVGSNWYVRFSGLQYQRLYGPYDMGITGTPATGDLDGDGLADLISAVGSNWYVRFSGLQYQRLYGPYTMRVP